MCCYTNFQNTHDCSALKAVENWSGPSSMQIAQGTSRVLKGFHLRKNFKWALYQLLLKATLNISL